MTICIKRDLALNTLQRLICHKTKQPTTRNHRINNIRPDIKLGLFTKDELCADLKTIKSRKAASLTNIYK